MSGRVHESYDIDININSVGLEPCKLRDVYKIIRRGL